MPSFLKSHRIALALSALALPLAALAEAVAEISNSGPGYTRWFTGNETAVRPQTEGAVLLMGGRTESDAAMQWFIEKAGGGDILVLRASGGDGYQSYIYEDLGGVNSVETIRFDSGEAAHLPEVVARIERADGIFLAGGDQSRYVTYWKDTPVGAALNAHIAAGRPVGGTSAGAAVLGEFAFPAYGRSVDARDVLRNPLSEDTVLERGFLRHPLLQGVITDTHFTERRRLGRLIGFCARAMNEFSLDGIVGLGVDEYTALCIEANGEARVMNRRTTRTEGRVWIVVPTRSASVLEAGQALEIEDVTVIALDPDSRLNLRDWSIDRPNAVSNVTASRGRLR